MSKRKRLVLKHLENISWRIIEEYPQVIKEIIKGKAGIYALYRKRKLYYVGLASNLMVRLKIHIKDRHQGKWDRFSVYLTAHDDHIKELESLLLRIVNPAGNKTAGRFYASENLRSLLNNRMKETDADRRSLLIGGSVARRRRKTKARKGKGSKSLAGIVERRIQLKGTYKGNEYKATLRKDGLIGFDGETYESPTGAAKAIVGRSCNGWSFWRYRNKNREWVRLKELRR